LGRTTAHVDGVVTRTIDARSTSGSDRSEAVLVAGVVVLAVVLCTVLMASIAFGSESISIRAAYAALVHADGSRDAAIVSGLRVPRTLLGLSVGVALGLAGAVMQGVTRNPLADPGILGVNAGAAFAVVLGIFLLGVTGPLGYVWFAFAGAAIASVLVYALGSRGRDARQARARGSGDDGAAGRADQRDPPRGQLDVRRLPVLGGRLAGGPRREHPAGAAAVPRGGCRPRVRARAGARRLEPRR
jgi:hypothetical protein